MNDQLSESRIKVYNINNNTNKLTIFFVGIDKCLFILIPIFLIAIGLAKGFEKNSALGGLYIMLIVSAIIILIILLSDRKIVFERNNKENSLIAKVYNYYCCRKKKKVLNYLNNIQFDIKTIKGDYNNSYFRLFMFNNLSRLTSFDLDKNDIKKKPLDLFYYFDKINNKEINQQDMINQLNSFTNSPSDFDSPLFFNSELYLSRNRVNNPNPKYSNPQQDCLSYIMRFSNYFFTYFIRDPDEGLEYSRLSKPLLIIYLDMAIFTTVLFIVIYALKVKKIQNSFVSFSVSVAVIIVIDIILILIDIFYLNYRLKRIDCIYSNDFDRMFIGLVPINEKCFKISFEFKLNEISKFYIKKNCCKTALCAVVDNQEIDICSISNKIDIDNFVRILNEKIIRN